MCYSLVDMNTDHYRTRLTEEKARLEEQLATVGRKNPGNPADWEPVPEETGLECELGAELTASSYRDRKGRPKRVRWWVMRPLGGEFSADDEVDEMRWVPVGELDGRLDYEDDRDLVREALPRWG